MADSVDAARNLLKVSRVPVEELQRQRDIRRYSSSKVDIPDPRQVLLENLDALTGCSQVCEENVEDAISLVVEWPEDCLEEVKRRVRELAKPVVTGGEGSGEEV